LGPVSYCMRERESNVMSSNSAGNGVEPTGGPEGQSDLRNGTPRAESSPGDASVDGDASKQRAPRSAGRKLRGADHSGAARASGVAMLADKARAKGVTAPYDPDTEEAAPLFWELCTTSVNADGTERLLPDLRLTRVGGGWQCVIQDVETSQETRFQFGAILDLARAAERHLTSAGCVWTKYKNRKNPKGISRHDRKNT
jgi:hypothetical protein